MARLLIWLREHTFITYMIALLLMVLAPVGLFFSAQAGATVWIWALLGMVVLGNLLVLAIN
jgi:hypothetical protein